MTLKTDLERELTALAAQGDLPAGSAFRVDTDVGCLTGEMTAVDTLACAFLRFALETSRLHTATIDELKTVSESLSQRLTYLLEPISAIEIDAAGCTVQMRSTPPQKEENGPTYYELTVHRDGLSLCRYQKGSGPRQRIPAQVTREVLARLASDFIGVIA
ncbi:hypothetical protein [Lignipirellula cremea]|uniref:Uncharacterized protein n=1 Tax=Lignipirellula cremea TaxID=2528010 RepID=A0A518DUI3_9BACT|nr:hypothetical protein [Lignipirellula cremea]QDU95502.1 hypothetical protein Pla8534_33170 [Lignipirellula cremea]